MKTKLKQLFILCAFVAPMVFQSCKKDDDDAASKTQKSVEYKYVLEFSKDLVDVANISVDYYDEGTLKNAVINDTIWSFEKKSSLTEKMVGYRLKLSMKETYPIKEKYDMGISASIAGNVIYSDGSKAVRLGDAQTPFLKGLKKDGLSLMINSFNGLVRSKANFKKADTGDWIFEDVSWNE